MRFLSFLKFGLTLILSKKVCPLRSFARILTAPKGGEGRGVSCYKKEHRRFVRLCFLATLSGKRGSTLRVDFHFIIRTSSAGLKPGACSASSFNRFIPRSQVLRTCCRPQRGRGSRVLVPQKKHRRFVRLCFLATWSGKRGSNPRPSAWEADALPTELLPRCLSSK